jgi:hypothetical protein
VVEATMASGVAASRAGVQRVRWRLEPEHGHRLGIPAHDAIELAVLPKEIARRDVDPEGKRVTVLLKQPSDLFEEFGVDAPDGIRLLLGSRVGHAGSG